MPYRRYHYRGRHRGGRDRDRALQHIAEAREFSREVGGADEDVKKYFFSLPSNQLRPILDEYEKKYGRKAREYAEEVGLSGWRSGRVTMSGMVKKRLFNLLPPRMPLLAKYSLVENLWNHYGPRSKKILRIGLDADLDTVVGAVNQHIENVVVHYRIPQNLERRFEWLSAGDVNVKQQLLNHFQQKEKSLVVEGARAQIPVMLEHLRSDASRLTHRVAQVLRVGNHELEILVDRDSSGVVLMEPSAMDRVSAEAGHLWLLWLLIAGLVLWYWLS